LGSAIIALAVNFCAVPAPTMLGEPNVAWGSKSTEVSRVLGITPSHCQRKGELSGESKSVVAKICETSSTLGAVTPLVVVFVRK
jgi:hypothetical protein